MTKSTTKRQGKPGKPRPDFPLYAHGNGQWAKKIRGRTHFFGVWDAPDDALEKYLDQRDELLAGRTPRPTADGFTVRDLCNHFMTAKAGQRDAGDITPRTFADYLASCKLIVDSFGEKRLVDDLKPSDFEQLRAALAKTRNPNTLGNEVQGIRVAFKYGYDADLIERPVKFGPTFKRPAKRILRAVKQSKDKRQYTATEIRDILGIATVPMRAMVLLGINCGYGNHDCGTLPKSAVDLKTGWADFPRPKTAIERRCPLWPETVKAIKAVLACRPEPTLPEHKPLLFITKRGGPWAKETAESPVYLEFRKVLDKLELRRCGVAFYGLRHTFATVGGGGRDQVAVNFIMGHSDPSMASIYRESIEDDRLRDITDHVRNWLFGKESGK